MLKDLFINAAILIAVISFGNALLREKMYSSARLFGKILTGLLFGSLGCALMIFSVRVAPDIIIDFRTIPILIMALYSSQISTITSSLTIGLFRILYFGLSQSSLIAFAIVLLVGVGCLLISKLMQKMRLKWIFAVFLTCAISSVGFFLIMESSHLLLSILVWFVLGLSVSSLAVYHLLSFHSRVNRTFSKAKEEAQKDFLTGLYNTRYGDGSLRTHSKTAQETQSDLSVLFLDIDSFKSINDNYGHLAGDTVLKSIAAVLTKECRSADVICRRGGDEFSVILFDCGLSKAKAVAERIRASINRSDMMLDSGTSIAVSVSIGISSYPATTQDGEKLIKQADEALYEAKRSGKNAIMAAL